MISEIMCKFVFIYAFAWGGKSILLWDFQLGLDPEMFRTFVFAV
jgi:hypothetical protein